MTPEDTIAKEYGLKPYLSADYTEMMRRTANDAIFYQSPEPHSEMLKPYKLDGYQRMEHFYPWGNNEGIKPETPEGLPEAVREVTLTFETDGIVGGQATGEGEIEPFAYENAWDWDIQSDYPIISVISISGTFEGKHKVDVILDIKASSRAGTATVVATVRRVGSDLTEPSYTGIGELKILVGGEVFAYYFAGVVGGSGVKTVGRYSVSGNSWESRTSFPGVAYNLSAACAIEYKGFVYGGNSDFTTRNECYRYNPEGDSWAQKTSMIQAIKDNSGSAILGKAYTYGGSATLTTCDEYDVGGDSWANKTGMNEGRRGMCADTVSDKGYTICGWTGAGYRHTCEEYDSVGNSWADKADSNQGRNVLSASNIEDKIYIYCGYIGGDLRRSIWCEEYNPVGNSWTGKADALKRRANHAGTTVSGKGYIYGGSENVAGQQSDDCDQYDATLNSWTSMTEMDTTRGIVTGGLAI